MLSLTTPKHHTFVTIPRITGCSSDDFGAYGRTIDLTIDRLLEKCQSDSDVLAALAGCSNRHEAYLVISRHLPAVTEGASWVGQELGTDVCRRVLYLLCPDRFGFDKYGWIH